MSDNRFAMMCVNRSGQTSRRTNGYETVQTGPQETGRSAAAWYAHAGARCGASGGGARLRGKSPDGVALGADGGRRPPGLATPAVGAPRGYERSRAGQAQQDVG